MPEARERGHICPGGTMRSGLDGISWRRGNKGLSADFVMAATQGDRLPGLLLGGAPSGPCGGGGRPGAARTVEHYKIRGTANKAPHRPLEFRAATSLRATCRRHPVSHSRPIFRFGAIL